MRYHILILLLLLWETGCKKKKNAEPDPSKVEITINAPQNGQTFNSGDTIYLNANINYNDQLHGCEVKIVDTVSGFVLYDEAQHVHSDKFVINEKWLNELTSSVTLKVNFIAYIDHNGKTVNQERYINVTQ